MEKILKIKTKNSDEIIEIEQNLYKYSKYFSDIVNHSNEFGELNDSISINLDTIEISTLTHTIEFLNYYQSNPFKHIPKPLPTDNLNEFVDKWYMDYISNKNMEEIFKIIQACNFLEVSSLLELTCAYVATIIKTKSVEEIRKIFNITNDFTKEEEEAIKAESRWCNDI